MRALSVVLQNHAQKETPQVQRTNGVPDQNDPLLFCCCFLFWRCLLSGSCRFRHGFQLNCSCSHFPRSFGFPLGACVASLGYRFSGAAVPLAEFGSFCRHVRPWRVAKLGITDQAGDVVLIYSCKCLNPMVSYFHHQGQNRRYSIHPRKSRWTYLFSQPLHWLVR